MKISVITKSTGGWYVDQLKEQADKQGVEIEFKDIRNLNNLEEIKELGDVILWRASSLGITDKRTAFLNIVKDRHIINHAILKHPYLTHKLFQQKNVEKYALINYIPTFTFKSKKELIQAVEEGTLKFPFIQKPDLGSKGQNVSLIKSFEDIEAIDIKFNDYVYQNFIKNNGDYRAFVLGGKVIAVMKRVAKEGSFLNNISQGGSAYVITDKKILRVVTDMATTITSLFDLTMAGVDIIYNEEDGKYYFLELNTAPQWQGIQAATGINVSGEIVKLCKAFGDREVKTTTQCVEEYYKSNYQFLYEKQFHFASRMYLWTKDDIYRKWLDVRESDYIGLTEQETENILKQDLEEKPDIEKRQTKSRKLRKEHFNKYPMLTRYVKLLFPTLFAETLYSRNIRPIVRKLVSDEEFMQLKKALMEDKEAVFTLSTHAINFFYLLRNYFYGESSNDEFFDPEYFYEIALNSNAGPDTFHFQIYLLTHCIIGESRFYVKKIENHKETYVKMIKLLEKIIFENYFSISLDSKMEFLVCTRLLDYKSYIETLILNEAERSLSNVGNYIMDKFNDKVQLKGDKLTMAEHRNVLYLMTSKDFIE